MVTSMQPGACGIEGEGEGEGEEGAVAVGVGVALGVPPAVGEGVPLGVAEGAEHVTRVTMFEPEFDTHSAPVEAEKSTCFGALSCPRAPMPGK